MSDNINECRLVIARFDITDIASELKEAGFEYIENLGVYQARTSQSYLATVVELKITDNGCISVCISDPNKDWAIKKAKQAFDIVRKGKYIEAEDGK